MNPERNSHRIYLIRHGETDWNKNFKYQGISDIPLNADGVEQARCLGVRLAYIRPDRIVASPLQRARRTAEIIAGRREDALGVETIDGLREVSFGIWEGLTVPEIMDIDGGTFEQWRYKPFSCTPKGGESFESISARSREVARQLDETGRLGEDTFVVAHGGVLRSLAAALLRYGDSDILWRMRFDNCSISVIDLWPGHPSLLLSNDTHHLRLRDDDEISALRFPD